MSYNFKDRLAYIGTRQDQVRGEVILYTTTNGVQFSISQVPGHTDVQDLSPHTAVLQVRYVDFIFFAADLQIGGNQYLPQRGDTVLWNGDLYVVTPPTDVDECYNFTTMYKDRLRVHTVYTITSSTTTTTTTTTTTSTTTTHP